MRTQGRIQTQDPCSRLAVFCQKFASGNLVLGLCVWALMISSTGVPVPDNHHRCWQNFGELNVHLKVVVVCEDSPPEVLETSMSDVWTTL